MPKEQEQYTREECKPWKKSVKPIKEKESSPELNKKTILKDNMEKILSFLMEIKNTNNIYINKNDVNEFGINIEFLLSILHDIKTYNIILL